MSSPGVQRFRIVTRVLVAILMGVFVLNCTAIVVLNSKYLPSVIRSQPWTDGFISHTAMLLTSFLIILIVSKGKLSVFGFCRGKTYKTAQIVIPGLATGIALEIVLRIFPEGSNTLQLNYSFAQTVIFIWLYASVSEEILTRGLVQGFLIKFTEYGFSVFSIRISLPVLIGALYFGLMHAALLTTGVALLPVICYVIFASILGLIAGYQREQTGSIIPAIIVHTFGNIGGFCMSILLK